MYFNRDTCTSLSVSSLHVFARIHVSVCVFEYASANVAVCVYAFVNLSVQVLVNEHVCARVSEHMKLDMEIFVYM